MLSAFWWKRTGSSRRRPFARRGVSSTGTPVSVAECSATETLENRALLTVNALFFAGELDIFATTNDSITVRTNPSNPALVQVLGNGSPVSTVGSVLASQISRIVIDAGSGDNVISLTGVGARFSSMLLDIAAASQLLALFFAMCIAILLGMGMPTTAAYAVAASVVAPGLVDLGIPQLTAHFFVFYFAVVSAITPPVALASYAAAGISGSNPMETSVASFKIGISAFVVPFMFFYNSAILMDGTWFEVIRAALTATVGVFLLSAGMQGWFMGGRIAWFLRVGLTAAALFMIEGGWITDIIGVGTAVVIYLVQKVVHPSPDATFDVRGAD